MTSRIILLKNRIYADYFIDVYKRQILFWPVVTESVNHAKVAPMSIATQSRREITLLSKALLVFLLFVIVVLPP